MVLNTPPMKMHSTIPRVVICGSLEFAQAECEELFKGVADVLVMNSLSSADLIEGMRPGGKYEGAIGLLRHWNGFDIFNRALIEALPPSVRFISSMGAGYDMIDVDACKEKGIAVSHTPGVGNDATAVTALYLIISALRRFSVAERQLRAGLFEASRVTQGRRDPTVRTLAIMGLGGIGLRLAELVHAFPMRVVYHNRRPFAGAPEWCEYYGSERLDEMLSVADVLSVHVPLRKDTVGLVDDTMIRKLQKGAVLINTARGKVIDEEAMIRALEDGHLSAVGLDVFPDEPVLMEVRGLTNLRDFTLGLRVTDLVSECR
ncbi:D-isomer specific 2-hydroxyacid dehydrogenase [Fomitopsis serialis]|uniref:D-isomer specific 2-hydroxyacid dehydrogenase n=1 Tax=Fomitopsis serialis TaxID=139415 RepID=UPI0020072180|nr:D-isomer specific 2-hydroxyacid dehydrogenase [Neoantrodia serialis]KAH9917543.1 D-isomer specific 2-hydroxyacid dehydrogenase [Neoantrodia serialis]